MRLAVLMLLLGCLRQSTSLKCPKPGRDPKKVDTPSGVKKFVISKSRRKVLCALVHVDHADPTNTTPLVLTSTTPTADLKVTPAARSYRKRNWEMSAGPFEQTGIKVVKCTRKKCVLRVKPTKVASYFSSGNFYLMSFGNEVTFEQDLSRFFGQTTFGGTRDMINGWSHSKDQKGMTDWLRAQMDAPATSVRETFRRGADFSLDEQRIQNAAVAPKHPCKQYSRWREYAFNSDDYGDPFEVQEKSGGRKLIVIKGMPRTYVTEFKSTTNGAAAETGTGFNLGFRVGGAVGGPVLYKREAGYKWVSGGNPKVELDSEAINSDPGIIVIDLGARSNFDIVEPIKAPNLEETPVGGSLRLKTDILNNAGCENLPVTANYQKVLGKFDDNSYVWYQGHAELHENTPSSPISDGGKALKARGIDYCSNVARNFINMENCTFSEESACAGSPMYNRNQPNLANTVVCGSPNEVANDPNLPVKSTNIYQFYGVADAMFYISWFVQKMSVWYKTKLQAEDQLRQRVAWAFSQLLVVTQNQIDNGDIWGEMFLNYDDIFVRNAFGNYRDILKEVSYSPMMGEMLSFVGSASALYALQREGRVSRPDENYAREIMQLFTVGLYKLNLDGTLQKGAGGLPIPTYDNYDIQTFARAWTGFQRHGTRSNYEGWNWNPNKIDPMQLVGDKRDPFPKLGLNDDYIADGYPLCRDLPQDDFLRKGATYRAVGNWNQPQLTPETNFWRTRSETRRISLETESSLYKALCNADDSNNCNYQAFVRLDEDLTCTGVECVVDTLTLIKIKEGLYYEYMPQPCAELAFTKDAKKAVNYYYRGVCADPGVKDVVRDTCCPSPEESTPFWRNKAWSYCEYSGEKVSYQVNEERCTSKKGTVCDFQRILGGGQDKGCGLGIQSYSPSWNWTNQTCSYQVKVENAGLISIVHNPNFDVNSEAEQAYQQRVHQMVSPENKNFFKIKWDDDAYPSLTNGCGTCQTLSDGCLCDVEIAEKQEFKSTPSSVEEILSRLKLGSHHPDWYGRDYRLNSDENGIQTFLVPEDQDLSKRAIFGVMKRGKMSYFWNKNSIVSIDNGATTYSFRNPPSLMKLLEQKSVDAYHETEAVLDHYIHHENTAPFIAKLMIKRFVTSNPSPSYVKRAAKAFQDGQVVINGITFGKGDHGNLEALFAAILLDTEARNALLDTDPSFGSMKEPMLKLFAFMRAMELELNESAPTLRFTGMINKIGQEPFATPNVFSFFLPEYANPGAVKDTGLTSPEAQIINSPTIIGFLNGVMSMVDTGVNVCYGGLGMKSMNNCARYSTSDPKKYSRGTLSFVPQSDTAKEVVDEMTLLLTAGRVTDSTRTILEEAYTELAGSSKTKALKMVMKLILMMPEFHATNVFKSIPESRTEPPLLSDPTNDYKAIVYVNLDGGLDSFNVLVPHSNCAGGKDMFGEYNNVRGSIAVNKNTLKTITVADQICSTFGIHQKIPILQELYNSGELSFFANMGVLQQPVTDKGLYRQQNSKTALFAHNTQQEEINSVDIADDTAGLGILGRMTDILSLGTYQTGTVSVAGGAPALVSNKTPLLVVNPFGYEKFNPVPWGQVDKDRIKAINRASGLGSSLFSEVWANKLFQSMSENDILYAQMSAATTTEKFENTDLGRQMGSIAKLIKTKSARKTDRDVFYVQNAGWDTHGEQAVNLDTRLKEMNDALKSFRNEMVTQNMWNDVTVVYVSEFGRTLKSNTGNGSDHAWGGNYFAASGSIKGGKVFGEYPTDLTSDGSQIISDVGIVIPSSPFEALWNGIAEWFGITNENDLKSILPNRQPFENMLYSGNDLFN